MTAQTPLFGIKYIAVGEPIRNTRQALEDNANTIEAALAQRVNAPTVPDLNAEIAARTAADTGEVTARTAADLALSNRITVLEAGAWTDLPTLGTGWATEAAGGETVQYRIEGKRVFLRGWLHSTIAGNTNTICGFPLGTRPSRNTTVWGHWDASPTVARMNISTAGIFLPSTAFAVNQFVHLAPISWGIA